MSAELLLGIIIGMAFVLVCFGILIAIPAKRTSKASQSFSEKSLEQLTERNGIGHDQIAALWKIADTLSTATEINREMLGHITLLAKHDRPAFIAARRDKNFTASGDVEAAGGIIHREGGKR